MDDAKAAEILGITMAEHAIIAQCEIIHSAAYEGETITDEDRATLREGLAIADKSESLGLLIVACYWSKYV